MSGRAWLLHQTAEVVGEPVVDAVYAVRQKPHHWPVVAATTAVGAWAGAQAPTYTGLFVAGLAFLGMGVGMNLRTQFRVLARAAGGMVLLDASSVDAHPVRLAASVRADDVTVVRRRPWWATVTVSGQAHVVARHQLPRLERMLARQASSHQSA